jgi:hypothetical protein
MATQSNGAGIYITQVGSSVTTAADYQFVFNSNWPSLQCAFDQLVTLSPGQSQTLAHNLGFPPFTQGWLLQNGVSVGRIFAVSESFEGYQANVTMTFDKTNVYLTNNDSVSWTVNVKCYNLDISTPANYTLPKYPLINQPYDKTTGIKVTKSGKQIKSTDLRDFILHSRAQSPAVLTVITQNQAYNGTTGGAGYFYQLVYQNPANYVPWTFAFIDAGNGTYAGLAPGGQQSGFIFLLTKSLTGYTTQTNAPSYSAAGASLSYPDVNPPSSTTLKASLVVLRDPLLVSGNVQVNYTGSPING